jgi:hypothetical protein
MRFERNWLALEATLALLLPPAFSTANSIGFGDQDWLAAGSLSTIKLWQNQYY